jgi:hypothetical protein
MSPAIFTQHGINTTKVSNATHTGDVTDASGVLTVNKINGVALSSFPNNTVLKTTTGGIIAAATANDYPTLNQSTTGNALTATTATKSTNIAGGATGSLPYQTANDSTAMLAAGTSGTVLKSNGAAPPSWSTVEKSMLSTALSDEITANTAKNSNVVHTGDVTDTAGVLKVTKINNVSLATLGTGILKNTTGTGTPSIAVAADFPTMTASVGGTGITSYSVGDLLYASSNTTLDKLSDIATGNALLSGGVNNAPSYGKVALSGAVTHITGTLSVANGGTGLSTITGYVKGTGTSALSTSATIPVADISGTLPVSNGGTGVTSSTGSGSVVLSNSPSLTTPNLGAPTGGTLTSCTGLPIIDGTTGTLSVTRGGTGNTTLTGYIKGNGTGAMSAVSSIPVTDLSGSFSVANGGTGQSTFTAGILKSTGGSAALETVTAPNGDLVGTTAIQTLTNKTLTAPALDTPISGTLTNCTGLPLATGVTGTLPVTSGGTGQTTLTGYVKGTGTTAMTAAATVPVADISGTLPVANGGTGTTAASTGSGGVVLSTSPTLVTPILGTPTSGTLTNCTGLPIINGTTGTLSVARGGTGNNGTAVDALVFDTLAYKTSSPSSDALATGEMRWNTTDKTLDLKLENDVTLQVGQEQNIYAQNAGLDDIPNGAAVYISGVATGDIPSVEIASSVNSLANKTLGVATQEILSGDYGYITLTGLVRGLSNAAGYTTTGMMAGDEIWLSTDGKWLNTQQTFINSQIKLGHVIQVSSTQGSILVNPRIIAGPSGQRVGGIINSNSTAYLSSSTAATVMNTYTVPATGFRNTGTIIKASYRGRITTAQSPANRQITLSIGPSGTPTTVFDSTSFTPSVTTPAILYWTLEATFSRVSNTELDVSVMLRGDGIPTTVLTTQYTNVTGLNLNSTPYLIILTGTSTDSSSAKAIGYDFSTISWDPT